MPVAVGETIDRYTVERLCGQGGMGEVYAALDTRLRRRVALKVVRANDARPDAVARIFREARAAAALSHPNTVAIHDLLEHGSDVTIVMELVSGKPLREYIGDATVPFVRKIEWLVAIARALAAAHRAGIIHRDVKPSNVMISDDGVVKVLDFGLARPADPMSFKTQRGYVLGTPKYMAPEQVEGHDTDARSDQYSCGVLAFELLTGRHPGLPGEARQPIVGIATPIASVIERMLEPVREARFETMDDVATVLEDRLRSADHAPPTAPDLAAAAATQTMMPDTERVAPASFAERRAAVLRAQPVLRTLASKEAPSELRKLRAGPPPRVMEHFDATMKSNEQADVARRAVVEEWDRRKGKVPLEILATHPSAGVARAVPPPSMPIELPKRSIVTPAVVIIAVVIATGLAGAIFIARRQTVPAAHASEPTTAATASSALPSAVPPPETPAVEPPKPTEPPLPPAKSVAPKPKPKPPVPATQSPPSPISQPWATPGY